MRRDARHSKTMTSRRYDDPPTYNPESDRTLWNRFDTSTQRFVAWAGAIAIIVTVCAWASQTIKLDERVSKLEAEQAETNVLLRANLAVSCILARKVDSTIEPSECNPRPPR